MSRDQKTYNLLLDYLSGSLGEEEKLALEKLWVDPEKRTEFLERGAIEHGGDAYYRQKFEVLHQQMKEEQSRRTRFIWMTGAAAAAIILVFWMFNFLGGGKEQLTLKTLYADNVPNPNITVRGEGMTFCMNPPLDPEKIIQELKDKENLDNICNRLLAVTYFNLQDYQKSYENWIKIDTNALFIDEVVWYQSLSLLKLKKYKESEQMLDSLLKSAPLSAFTNKAQELKENLPALIKESESK
ncbi:MAG: hypothetical protein R8P61_23905 [Bacteroidia bacterium]|nr:hypothetical protein [Bacteroidia bacterium]